MFETWSVGGRRPGDGLEPVTSEGRRRVASPPAPRGGNRGHVLRRRQCSITDEVDDGAGVEEGCLELGFAQTTGTAAAGTSCRHVYVDEPGSVKQAAKLAADERAGTRSPRGEDGLATFQPGVRGGDGGLPQSASATPITAPGRAIRRASTSGTSGSATCCRTAHTKMASTLPLGNGRWWMSPRTKRSDAGPGLRSTPTTIPSGPTAAPNPTVTDPGPQPRSTRRSPERTCGTKNAATESTVRRARAGRCRSRRNDSYEACTFTSASSSIPERPTRSAPQSERHHPFSLALEDAASCDYRRPYRIGQRRRSWTSPRRRTAGGIARRRSDSRRRARTEAVPGHLDRVRSGCRVELISPTRARRP